MRIVDAAKESNTPVTDYLHMPIHLFMDIWKAICEVNRRRAEVIERMTSA